ncbi:MAG: hypothetical protein AB8E15_02395 [Bdellovibrionales bacterium]
MVQLKVNCAKRLVIANRKDGAKIKPHSKIYSSILYEFDPDSPNNSTKEYPIDVYDEDSAEISFDFTFDREKQLIYIVGVTGFTQNPNGMSVNSNGQLFVHEIQLGSRARRTKYIRLNSRKEYATNLVIDGARITLGIGYNGPITHSADDNILMGYQSSGLLFLDRND